MSKVREIKLYENDGMGAVYIIYRTNAPKSVLKALENLGSVIVADTDDWAYIDWEKILKENGYIFEFVSEYADDKEYEGYYIFEG